MNVYFNVTIRTVLTPYICSLTDRISQHIVNDRRGSF